ncbi:NAD(P)H-dependent flavin oxidoreductase [Mycobacterium branderi]|nr:nitronate monooxygenase [Mycobacterium branderi]
MRTRVSEMLGIDYPILQAPMGYIARAQLAAAVSQAGGMGIIETSSGDLPAIREEIVKLKDATDKPFGLNIALLHHANSELMELVAEHRIRFVTTSAGDPTVLTQDLHSMGVTVFHVVPSLKGALKAAAAGVDGLVVEGNEGGGFKTWEGAATMVLLPLVASKVALPIVAAGGITDGRSMAAAFALGAEGVQMGTRMLSSAESPVHQNYKQLVVNAAETDTLLLNRESRPSFRVLRTPVAEQLAQRARVTLADAGDLLDLYFGGRLEHGLAFGGQVAGRIDTVKPVAQIIAEMIREFAAVLTDLTDRFVAGSQGPAAEPAP